MRSFIIIRTAPAANTIISKPVGPVKVNLLGQHIEPDIDVFPEKDRGGYGLLLDFHGLCVVFNPVVFTSTDRFRFPDPVKCQNLLAPIHTVYDPSDRAGLEH